MSNLRSRSYVRIVDLLSEGEIEGLVDGLKSVYFNETQVESDTGRQNFQGVTVVEKTGTNDQAAITFIPGVENEISVETEVKNGSPGPVVRTITDPDITRVRVRIRFPSLVNINTSNGSVNGASVNIKIYLQSNGGGYTQKINNTVSGKASSGYERDYEIALTGEAPWDIKVERVTTDSTSTDRQDQSIWKSYTEIIDQKFRYPNSAIIGVRFDSQSFSGTPRRAYDVKLLKVKVPSNYDPTTRTYSGVWDGTFKAEKEWTDNPAWCFYDLVTNSRYGLGAHVPEAQVDKWALYQIAQYCDEMVDDGLGGQEPRFTCNIYIQARQEAYKVVQDMASIFRGMVYWASGALTVSQDSPSDPVALFNASNVVDGLFTYSGTASKVRHTVALVSWTDPADFYRQKIEYVEDTAGIARYGIVETEVTAVGCASRGQANRVGRWILYSEQHETETVSFRTGIEGCTVRPGNVIKIQDPTRSGARYGGRVSSATTTTVTVDADFTIPASSTLFVMLPDGSVESQEVSSKTGEEITVGSAFSAAPQAGAVWMVSAPSVEVQSFRVISMAEAGDGQVEITALKHDPDKYDAVENGLALEVRDYTTLTVQPDPPSSVTLSESLYTYQAEVRAKITASWPQVAGATSYRVEWIKDGNNSVRQEVQANDFEILNITPGEFEVRVYSVASTGQASSDYESSTLTALGKTAPPSDVSNFNYLVDASIGATLTWDPVPDLDLDTYEIRKGSSWNDSTLVARVKATAYKLGAVGEGNSTFLIKALDTSGGYSTNEASTTVVIEDADAPTITGAFVNDSIVLEWDAVTGTLATEFYDVRYGDSFDEGTSVGKVKATTISIKAQWSGSRMFWIAAVDIAGNYGDAGSFDAIVTAPSGVAVTQEVIDNNVLLRWEDATETLPISTYEVRKGDTYATSTLIGRTASRFSVVFESTSGFYTYYIQGIDVAGNQGAVSSVTASVAEPPDYSIQFNQNSTFSGTKSNFISLDDGKILGPFDTSETWSSHFSSRSYSTIQDQIDAGFGYFLQPTASSGYYEEEFDYGTVLTATRITTTSSVTNLDGSATVSPTISVRKLSTDAWTDYADLSSVYVRDFQYAKIRYNVASSGGDDLTRFDGINVRFDVKLKNDAGEGTASSSDTGGTTVNFNVDFVDVQSITVTPKTTSAVIAVYDFTDGPNPTSFKVLLFNTSGSRVSGPFSWSAKGV